jgi:hypothetical protein
MTCIGPHPIARESGRSWFRPVRLCAESGTELVIRGRVAALLTAPTPAKAATIGSNGYASSGRTRSRAHRYGATELLRLRWSGALFEARGSLMRSRAACPAIHRT